MNPQDLIRKSSSAAVAASLFLAPIGAQAKESSEPAPAPTAPAPAAETAPAPTAPAPAAEPAPAPAPTAPAEAPAPAAPPAETTAPAQPTAPAAPAAPAAGEPAPTTGEGTPATDEAAAPQPATETAPAAPAGPAAPQEEAPVETAPAEAAPAEASVEAYPEMEEGPERPDEPVWGRNQDKPLNGKGMIIAGGATLGAGAAFLTTAFLITTCNYDSALECRYQDQRTFLVPTAATMTGVGILTLALGISYKIRYKKWQEWTPEKAQATVAPMMLEQGGGLSAVARF